MDDFAYRHGELHCGSVPVSLIAERFGTPTYIYSASTLLDHHRKLARAFAALKPLICYSVKSSGNINLCRLLASEGAGMDVVSGGELHRAMAAGCPAERCVYAGVGKTDAEIEFAILQGVGVLNVESEAEFEVVAAIAARLQRRCVAALRVNPDVDPKTHRYTSTGRKETKFGVDIERARAFFALYGNDPWCRLTGLHLHIGSPVYTVQPYLDAITKTLTLIDDLKALGHTVDTLDLGGGFAADYETGQSPEAAEYAQAIVPLLEPRVRDGLRVILEPGRTIVANAGILLTRVLYMKQSGDKMFAICDAGMNTLMRPCHYDAFHFIWPTAPVAGFVPPQRARTMELDGLALMDVVGPICESGDFLAIDRPLPPLRRGDLVAVFTAGAYGMSMASRYNSVPLPAEVLVEGDQVRSIRRRESWDDLIAHER
ncbi:MAG: diaminopimelate decarboxylase [Phycisphaerae bacterium]|nr:diaminopimelate decarboxylase [Phycisphaerae bacterium]